MPAAAQALRRTLDALYLLGGALSALCLVSILLIIVAQMIARWAGVTFPGAASYAGYAMAGASFFGFAYAFTRGAHIRVGIVLNMLGPSRRWLELVCLAVGAAVASYVAWFAVRAVGFSIRFGDVSQGLDRTPLWIPQSAMVAGSILLAVALWDALLHLALTGRSRIAADAAEGEA